MDLDEWLNASKAKRWSVSTGELHDLVEEAADQRDQARAEHDVAVEALAFYADPTHYIACMVSDGNEAHEEIAAADDSGKRARACLARLPHVAEHAQAQRDVIAAAREYKRITWDEADKYSADERAQSWGGVLAALARLDALEPGGGG